jgi:hypothetical protein
MDAAARALVSRFEERRAPARHERKYTNLPNWCPTFRFT